MACTKETYTATATWTASQLADIFRDAFIDASLMTDWYDSFLSGSIENRILEATYDDTKAYGKTYYWWMFSSATSAQVRIHVATGWNAITHVPTGTQYLDYFSTTTNSNTNHHLILNSGNPSVTVELVRYTSGVDSNQSWFVLKASTSRHVFSILHPSNQIQSWLNLNEGFYTGYTSTICSTSNQIGSVGFGFSPFLRREITRGCSLVGNTSAADYTSNAADERLAVYAGIGHLSNSNLNYQINTQNWIFLPVGFSATNPAYTSNSNPVFHSMPFSPYVVDTLPSDFGVSFHYATNTFSPGDTLVVSAGVEEWEVLDFASGGSVNTNASPLFLARMV